MLESSTPQLPNYTPSVPLPSYTHELASGERRLQHTPRSNVHRPTSVFIKKSRKAAVVLNDQEESARIPTFGRASVISGSISLEDRHNILEVKTYIEGKLETTSSEAGGGTHTLLKDNYTLWSRPSISLTHDLCPGDIPFAFILPSSFKNGDETVPLPPSYLRHFIDIPILFVRVSYQLRFVITRVPCRKLGIWHTKKRIVIPFQYLPRTRAHRPILRSPCFFSSVKTSPEEWYQAVTCLKTGSGVKSDPIHCHLFLPAGRVYSVKDTIPFHVQLSANTDALTELFSSEPFLNRVTSADTDDSRKFCNQKTSKPLLRVYLVRQVLISTKGAHSFRNTVLGEGVIQPVPPAFSCSCNAFSACRERHVDWEGEVRCKDEIIASSFNVMHVQVKDFITLSLSPPKGRPTPLLDIHISVPIKLVTDSFSDGLMDTAL